MSDLFDPPDTSRRGRDLTGTVAAGLQPADSSAAHFQATTLESAGYKPAATAPILLFERVSKWYGPVIGVNQVTLELRAGITGLVGANGAGKSTLMRLAAGQLRPHLGRVSVLGHDARSTHARLLVGYCPEVDSFYEEMSGRQFVWTMARLCGFTRREARVRTEKVLLEVGMADRCERRLGGYSKGMRQRIKLAQALLHDPPLLLLDEPLSGIDPVGRQEMVALFLGLARQGKCLLISSHELDELEKLTDHVAIMARGRIAAVGTVSDIRERLEDQPLSIRIDVDDSAAGPLTPTPPPTGERGGGTGRNGAFHVEHAAPGRHRDLAARLMQLPQVVSVEVVEDGHLEPGVGRMIVRSRQPRAFFRDLTRLVLEEWYEVRRLETLDESTSAVLGYLLGGSPPAT
jgi:ABC-2 type transport system ATP-binding protein